MRLVGLVALTAAVVGFPAWAQQRPFDLDAMMRLARISEYHLSPDGTQVAFTVQRIEVEKNSKPRQIWMVGLDGGTPRQVTFDGNNYRPKWSPDSKRLAFISTRGGSAQVWVMGASGSDARQVTRMATEADGVLWTGDGKNLVFVSEVFPDCPDEACNQRRLEEEKNAKVKARTYTSLLYRHWDTWQGARRKHLFVVPAEGGSARDLTPGPHDVPPFSLGGPDDYAVSPDGAEVCFVMNADPLLALSTNSDLYVVPVEGGEIRKVTENVAADNSPAYSADGRYIAYRAQSKAGFESDRWRLMLLDRSTGVSTSLTQGFARSIGGMVWTADSKRLFFTAEDRGRQAIHMIPVAGGATRAVVSGSSHVDEPQLSPDSKTMVYLENSGSKPTEIYKANSAGGPPVPLTRLNDETLAEHHLSPLEEIWVEGADRAQIHSFVVKPPGFRASEKYPVLFLIHGGPQGAWGESWSYRWNPQVFAAAGFVVVMPNPRGSTGYGQKFTEEVSGDWGGKVYDDIMAVVGRVERLPYVDPERMAAAGGSFGGYMVNWMLGHTNKFKAYVSHAGVYDLRSMGGETEELWFTKWEFGGMPWENPEVYERWSPSNFVRDFKTPTLVIHGEQDFRVPFGQGLQLFTGLQMQKVPSKLLVFPDEGHWILKPQNTALWYKTFLDWVTEWTRKPAPPPPPTATP
ncbi:MAG: S9 family peptidase [Bryobacterales bacterium]|nr:S9 family peptidase [Bryobacterales bacterium]